MGELSELVYLVNDELPILKALGRLLRRMASRPRRS